MASNRVLQAAPQGKLLPGFGNLARREIDSWWRTRKWLVHVLTWAAIVNGLLAMVLWVAPAAPGGQAAADPRVQAAAAQRPESSETALTLFFVMAVVAPAVGVVILGQETLIPEKQNGTAAWILSKPISRTAFVLSKLWAHSLGILGTMVIAQGIIAYAQISARLGAAPAPLAWLAGLGLIFLSLLFYLSFTLMLGAFFNSRGPVIGLPMILIFGYQFFLGIAPWLGDVLPYLLTVSLGPTRPSLALLLMQGQPLPTLLPVICTVGWTILFTVLAAWRFGREEF